METWFWILGWVLSFLAIIGNGFIIFLVCSRRNLRTKTNAFSFVSIIVRVRKHYGSAHTLFKQLRYNHRCVSLKTYHGEKSAVIMMGIVIGVFVTTYGMYLHCSFLILFDTTGMASCNDVKYKFPVLVLNSAINPLAYAFFKRDVKKEFRRLISINMFLKKGNQVKPSTYVLDTRRHLSSSLV